MERFKDTTAENFPKLTKDAYFQIWKCTFNHIIQYELLRWFSGKESICQCRKLETWVWFQGQEDTPGEGDGNSLKYSCLGNPMLRRAWRAVVHRVAKSQRWLKRLSLTIRNSNFDNCVLWPEVYRLLIYWKFLVHFLEARRFWFSMSL